MNIIRDRWQRRHGNRFGQPGKRAWSLAPLVGTLLILAGWMQVTLAQDDVTLDKVTYSTLPGDRVQVRLKLSGPVKEPLTFAIDKPARVALDFPGVKPNLERRTETIGVGLARSITTVEAGGRTRVVLSLVKLVPYDLRVEGSDVIVTLNTPRASAPAQAKSVPARSMAKRSAGGRLQNIDFRRGSQGEGRIIVTLSDPSLVVDTHQEGDKIVVDFLNASVPEELVRRLDVVDFATPVQMIDTFAEGTAVRMMVSATGLYDHLAYQSDDLFTLEIKPLTKEEEETLKKEKLGYTGERLSLNFQNIEVRAVLQLIADFTGLNLVASDTVGGNLTLRLKNVPWDQALDIILKTKGLAMRQTGNVVLVAPSEEIAAREKLELEAQKQITELAPLRTEFIQVNYANAGDVATLLKAEGNSLMSERGNVTVDARTNTLLVRDTAENLAGMHELVRTLDIPVRQVLIESRIVIADDTFTKELGVKFGLAKRRISDDGMPISVVGGKLPGDTTFDPNNQVGFLTNGQENYIVNLPIGAPSASLGLAIFRAGSQLLQMELQAMQAEGRGEVLSNPRVVTSNQKEALIEQGTEIPYQEASSSGSTSVSFKKAVLSLRVKPQITPDDRIIMDLDVSQDTVGQEFAGIPSVNTRAVTTQVLVDNGETVVLGGIYEQTQRDDVEKVPFWGDLPYLGFMFRQTTQRDDKSELLIFVTPKILKESLSLR
jgi:type IV pilus assembly protein PilQ